MPSNQSFLIQTKILRERNSFGTNIRYLSIADLRRFFECIDNPNHLLMMKTLYELGCRVGEFVRIRLKHLDFENNAVFFPQENTKTKRSRTSFISEELMEKIIAYLRKQGHLTYGTRVVEPERFLFTSTTKRRPKERGMSESAVLKMFLRYMDKTGLQQVYGHDKKGRSLHQYTVHSLRHSHIMHAKHIYGVKDSIIAKQVGHVSLRGMSFYDQPADEMVRDAYERARQPIYLATRINQKGYLHKLQSQEWIL